MSSYTSFVELVAHAVFDVVVNDEVQLLFRKAIVLRRQFVDLVDDGLGKRLHTWILFHDSPRFRVLPTPFRHIDALSSNAASLPRS